MFRRTPYIAADALLPSDGCNSATSHLRMTHSGVKFGNHILDFIASPPSLHPPAIPSRLPSCLRLLPRCAFHTAPSGAPLGLLPLGCTHVAAGSDAQTPLHCLLLCHSARAPVLVPCEMSGPIVVHGLIAGNQLILGPRDFAVVSAFVLASNPLVGVRKQALPRAGVALLRLPPVGSGTKAVGAAVMVAASGGKGQQRRHTVLDV
mmetsp:Transcript_19732/g.48876  ORF Transcript_19732/g.48876 Transcript_19732/m.48876 type:complete len:205 (-) Transcript_19732:1221-1835(-)